MMKIVVALFLILHGLVHAILAMVPNPDAPDSGFATFFSRSWLLDKLGLPESAVRTVALVLAATATIGFVAAGLGLLGILVPFAWWRALAITSAAVSLLFLVVYWNSYLIVGIAIDVLILAVLIFTNWTPE